MADHPGALGGQFPSAAAMAAEMGAPLSDWDHPAWRWREEIRGAAVREISGAMIGAVEALLLAPVGDDSLRAALTMLCQTWRAQQARRPATTVDATRAQSGAELIDQFLTDLDTWAAQCGLPGAPLSLQAIRWFAEGWLPAGEIPPADAAAIEDGQCLTMRAAVAHIDALTRSEA